MIVPNKFFKAKAGVGVRRLLAHPGRLELLVDFGEEQLFDGATNYSSIVITRAGTGEATYMLMDKRLRVLERLAVESEALRKDTWSFVSTALADAFARMDSTGVALGTITKRFGTGVQTGADPILCLTGEKASDLKLEKEALRPILRGRDVRRFAGFSDLRRVVFPYRENQGQYEVMTEVELRKLKAVHRYLKEHEARLSERVWFDKTAEELCGHWYGLMYVDSAWAFRAPHLLTPSLSDRANFTLGDGSLFATGTAGVTSVIPNEDIPEDIHYLLAVLNSKALSVYATSHSQKYQGAYYKFSAPYLKRLPIPRVDFKRRDQKRRHDELVSLCKRRLALTKELSAAVVPTEITGIGREVAAVESAMDLLVYEAFGLSQKQRDAIEAEVLARFSKKLGGNGALTEAEDEGE